MVFVVVAFSKMKFVAFVCHSAYVEQESCLRLLCYFHCCYCCF